MLVLAGEAFGPRQRSRAIPGIARGIEDAQQKITQQSGLARTGFAGDDQQPITLRQAAGCAGRNPDDIQHRPDRLFGVRRPLKPEPLGGVHASVFFQLGDHSVLVVAVELSFAHEFFEFVLGDVDGRRVFAHVLWLENVRDDQHARTLGIRRREVGQFNRSIFLEHPADVLLVPHDDLDTQQLLLQLHELIDVLCVQDLAHRRSDEDLFPGVFAEIGRDHIPDAGEGQRATAIALPVGVEHLRIGQAAVAEISYSFQQMTGHVFVFQEVLDRDLIPKEFRECDSGPFENPAQRIERPGVGVSQDAFISECEGVLFLFAQQFLFSSGQEVFQVVFDVILDSGPDHIESLLTKKGGDCCRDGIGHCRFSPKTRFTSGMSPVPRGRSGSLFTFTSFACLSSAELHRRAQSKGKNKPYHSPHTGTR